MTSSCDGDKPRDDGGGHDDDDDDDLGVARKAKSEN